MKIALVTSFFPSAPSPYTGAPILAQLPYLKELAEIGVFCPRATYPPLRLMQPRNHLYRPPDGSYDLPGIDAENLPFFTFPVVGRALNGYLSGRAVFASVQRFEPDLVLSYAVYPDGYGAIRVARKLGKPVVLFAIGSDVRYVADSVQRRLVRSALDSADYVLSVSNELRERAIDLGAARDRSRAIMNGCDTSVFRPIRRDEARALTGVSPGAGEIVFVGRLVPLKGLRELLDALSIVRRTLPNVELTMIGEGPLDAELRERAGRADLLGSVRFLAAAKPAEVALWMAASDVTCLPSYSEGCPNVIVESLACGRPVVATNVGGIPELLNESNGMMVRPRESGELADALVRALETRWDEASIAAAAKRSWRDVAFETVEACGEVLRTYTTAPLVK
jgi:glycosyltransferase involved in cell wall biosynthesis